MRILLRANSGFAREALMAWCEKNQVDYVFGLARNDRLVEEISVELIRTCLKPAHLSACPPIPSSRLPTVLPLSSTCSRSVALGCSLAEPLPRGKLEKCRLAPPRSTVRTSAQRYQAGHRHRPDRGRQAHLLAPHRRAIRRCRLCYRTRTSDARMSTATLKRELALLRSSLAALTPAWSATLGDPIAWAERIAGLTLDPWQRDVLLSGAPRLLLNATPQSGKSTVAALKAAWTVLQGGLAVVVSPSLRQSGFPFRKLSRHLVASDAAFRRETLTEIELISGGSPCRCLAIVPPCCAAFRCATTSRRC